MRSWNRLTLAMLGSGLFAVAVGGGTAVTLMSTSSSTPVKRPTSSQCAASRASAEDFKTVNREALRDHATKTPNEAGRVSFALNQEMTVARAREVTAAYGTALDLLVARFPLGDEDVTTQIPVKDLSTWAARLAADFEHRGPQFPADQAEGIGIIKARADRGDFPIVAFSATGSWRELRDLAEGPEVFSVSVDPMLPAIQRPSETEARKVREVCP